MSIEEVIKWCDEMIEKGHTIALGWDGGHDSGWVWLEIDEEQIDNVTHPAGEWLIEQMYDTLDYGSWAGEFNASGRAEYNPETKEFEGTDNYSWEENDAVDVSSSPVDFRIPISLDFEKVLIHTEDSDFDTQIALEASHRLEHPDEEKVLTELAKEIKEKFNQAFDKSEASKKELASTWHDYDIPKSEMRLEGDHYVGTIDHIYFNYYEVEEKGVSINLKEQLENAED
jgi:hypothetical protein